MAIDWAGLVVAPCIDAFGDTTVTYTPAAGGSYTVTGVFDHSYHSVDVSGDGVTLSSAYPVLGIAAADLPVVPKQGDTLVIASTTAVGASAGDAYRVREPRPDGHGHILLLLTEFDTDVLDPDVRTDEDDDERATDDGSDRVTEA